MLRVSLETSHSVVKGARPLFTPKSLTGSSLAAMYQFETASPSPPMTPRRHEALKPRLRPELQRDYPQFYVIFCMRLDAQLRGERLVVVQVTNATDWKTKIEAGYNSKVLEYPIGPGKGEIEGSKLYVAADQRTALALLRPRYSSPKPNPRFIGDGELIADTWRKGHQPILCSVA